MKIKQSQLYFSRLWNNPILWSLVILVTLHLIIPIIAMVFQFVVLETVLGLGNILNICIISILEVFTVVFILNAIKNYTSPPLNFPFTARSFFYGLQFSSSALIYAAVFIVDIAMYISQGSHITAEALITCAAAAAVPGFCEEIGVRALVMPCFLYKFKNKPNGIILSAAVSAIIFGMLHLVGLSAGDSIISILLQTVYTSAFGFMMAAAYLRSGNLWAITAMHWFVDFTGMLSSKIALPGIASVSYKNALVIIVTITLLFTVCGCRLLRREKLSELRTLWKLDIENDVIKNQT